MRIRSVKMHVDVSYRKDLYILLPIDFVFQIAALNV